MMHCTEKKNMDIEKMFDSDQPTVQSERNPNQTLQFASALCSYFSLVYCRLVTTFVPFWLIAPRTFENKLFTPAWYQARHSVTFDGFFRPFESPLYWIPFEC